VWPPWEVVGAGRFDDPQREFRVLYAAAQRRGAFVETMAQFRPLLEALARMERLADGEQQRPRSVVPADWYQRRGVGRLLRADLAALLVTLGLSNLDLTRVLGPRRTLTQAIARWAYERGYAGLAYAGRLDGTLTLWALFERPAFEPIGLPEPLTPDDLDLVATARLVGLLV
jgi:RES domain